MLNAILRGKKKGSGLEGTSLLEFDGAEDLLTATLFERLSYLPDETLGAILFADNIWRASMAAPPSRMEKIEFWPRWRLSSADPEQEDTKPDNGEPELSEQDVGVEPDVLIDFADRLLVVEAKRSDFVNQQNHKQLAREYERAKVIFPGRPIWLLAIGGLANDRPSAIAELRTAVRQELFQNKLDPLDDEFHFTATSWRTLFAVIKAEAEEINGRLVSDIRKGLALHGIAADPPIWLVDLGSEPWRSAIRPIRSSPAAFDTQQHGGPENT